MELSGSFNVVKSNKLRYTEYFGDGDSKSYRVVKDVYNSDNNGVSVVKKECVGHVQKSGLFESLERKTKRWAEKVN